MVVENIRKQFPELAEKVYGKPLVYFDNAATMQRPFSVIEKWDSMSAKYNSNIHRAVHFVANVATEEFEQTRDVVKDFLNASDRGEIVFTSGTTGSINLVAFSFGERFVNSGDEIIVSEAEHHSNIVPWQMLCQRKGATLRVIPIDEDGHLKIEEFKKLLNDKTRIVAVSQVSNVLGIINPIEEIIEIAHSKNVPVLIDGAQGVVHCGMDVQKTDCDFYAFSGHKIFAATGVGVLYGKRKWMDEMPPYMGGGEMINTVRFSGTTFAETPGKFEAGTQNLAGVPTLKPALEMSKLMHSEKLVAENNRVKKYLYEKLSADKRIRIFGVPRGTDMEDKISVFSFKVDGVHHEDLALILDKMGIATRSGQMCCEPLMDRYEVTGMLRISLVGYNTMSEAEYFLQSLEKAISMLQ